MRLRTSAVPHARAPKPPGFSPAGSCVRHTALMPGAGRSGLRCRAFAAAAAQTAGRPFSHPSLATFTLILTPQPPPSPHPPPLACAHSAAQNSSAAACRPSNGRSRLPAAARSLRRSTRRSKANPSTLSSALAARRTPPHLFETGTDPPARLSRHALPPPPPPPPPPFHERAAMQAFIFHHATALTYFALDCNKLTATKQNGRDGPENL